MGKYGFYCYKYIKQLGDKGLGISNITHARWRGQDHKLKLQKETNENSRSKNRISEMKNVLHRLTNLGTEEYT